MVSMIVGSMSQALKKQICFSKLQYIHAFIVSVKLFRSLGFSATIDYNKSPNFKFSFFDF
jgi:hypothetical protein